MFSSLTHKRHQAYSPTGAQPTTHPCMLQAELHLRVTGYNLIVVNENALLQVSLYYHCRLTMSSSKLAYFGIDLPAMNVSVTEPC